METQAPFFAKGLDEHENGTAEASSQLLDLKASDATFLEVFFVKLRDHNLNDVSHSMEVFVLVEQLRIQLQRRQIDARI